MKQYKKEKRKIKLDKVFVVMSTHFHLVAYSENVDSFCKTLSLSYTIYFNLKYNHSGNVMAISSRLIDNIPDLVGVTNYVLKNPIHHKVSFSPFQYPYSTIGCYFSEYYCRQNINSEKQTYKKPSDLSYKERKRILGTSSLPESFLIKDLSFILPDSYLDISQAKAIYQNSYKTFLYNMIKNQTDNYEQIGGKSSSYTTMESLSMSAQKISDIKVCEEINSFVTLFKVSSFLDFDDNMKDIVIRHLRQIKAEENQIKRCLWI